MNNVRVAGYRLFDPSEDKGPIFLREIGFSLTMESTCSWRRDVFDSTCKTWPFSFERKPIDLWLSKCYYYKLYLSNHVKKEKERRVEKEGERDRKELLKKKKIKKSATRKVFNVFFRDTPVFLYFLYFLYFFLLKNYGQPRKLIERAIRTKTSAWFANVNNTRASTVISRG